MAGEAAEAESLTTLHPDFTGGVAAGDVVPSSDGSRGAAGDVVPSSDVGAHSACGVIARSEERDEAILPGLAGDSAPRIETKSP